ncbi:phosphoglycerate kinase [Patescibacteria group bacterium]|nr:phosphoglycerate kinase [Patescibacteria group bacterium]
MKLNTIKQVKTWRDKRVLLRLDLNVVIHKNKVHPKDAWRLERALPTIKFLLKNQAKVIIVAHLGRPNAKVMPDLSLKPVVKYLSQSLKQDIKLWAGNLEEYVDHSKKLKAGQLVMLENIRFHAREQKNCRKLAKKLANLADIYVNDAFSNMHRDKDTSMMTITKFLPSYAGLLVEDEIKHLSAILASKKGLGVVFGGAKVSTKIGFLHKISQQAQVVFLGGILANTVLASRGFDMGALKVVSSELKIAKQLSSQKIHLPLDVVVAKNMTEQSSATCDISQVPANMLAFDIGPKTAKQYLAELTKCKLIVWNGPLGYFENKYLSKNSVSFAKALSKIKVKIIVGGGETVAMLNELNLLKKFTFVSTGGGALMAFLDGKKLPALEALIKK